MLRQVNEGIRRWLLKNQGVPEIALCISISWKNWKRYLLSPRSDIHIPPIGCHKSDIVLRREGKWTTLSVRQHRTKQIR
ncbi:hypothetical protein E1A91_A10G144900v1 [Gossypium mustelinum]|uniref:Uncharacterized protein n=1 Tax=Gossypium mustelinum TaxID=34275 RepID=A0A5D2XLU9_GOSMU|nr:hypothetical protein E1A91_A10G144900v1 [Gossypium mustelinum]